MTSIEITIKLQCIAAVFSEYLAYYEPIYRESIKQECEKLPYLVQKKEYAKAIAEFGYMKAKIDRFSDVFEKFHPEEHDAIIDKLHEALNEIIVNYEEL